MKIEHLTNTLISFGSEIQSQLAACRSFSIATAFISTDAIDLIEHSLKKNRALKECRLLIGLYGCFNSKADLERLLHWPHHDRRNHWRECHFHLPTLQRGAASQERRRFDHLLHINAPSAQADDGIRRYHCSDAAGAGYWYRRAVTSAAGNCCNWWFHSCTAAAADCTTYVFAVVDKTPIIVDVMILCLSYCILIRIIAYRIRASEFPQNRCWCLSVLLFA